MRSILNSRARRWIGASALAILAGIGGGTAFVAATAPSSAQSAKLVPAAQITAPAVTNVPNFADLVDAVKPAVVSIIVEGAEKSPARQLQRGGGQFQFNFPDLPDDHPFKDFFNQFGQEFGQGNQGQSQDRDGTSSSKDQGKDQGKPKPGQAGQGKPGDQGRSPDDAQKQDGQQGDHDRPGQDGKPQTPEQRAAEQARAEAARKALQQQMDKALGKGKSVKSDAEQPHQLGLPDDSDPTSRLPADVRQALQRVPDDPGALLRRKFELEYRQRHGGAPAEDDEP